MCGLPPTIATIIGRPLITHPNPPYVAGAGGLFGTSSENWISLLALRAGVLASDFRASGSSEDWILPFAGVHPPETLASASTSVRVSELSASSWLLWPAAGAPRESRSGCFILEGTTPCPVRRIGAVPCRTCAARFASTSSGSLTNLPKKGIRLRAWTLNRSVLTVSLRLSLSTRWSLGARYPSLPRGMLKP